ncbi:uncharacterized protein LOC114292365 [Camellia sinensis]|uniref:uncharacterized protein LOC114292365 n=1 Tax=Camellia sinensis TaxID=4442 RepID=UPI001036B15A|nr:uncharacterized protein LOC114292365 [Camellia sinensis]
METFAMEDIEVFEFIERLHDRLCVFFCGFIFSLNLDQEPVKVIDGHDSIFGVTVEEYAQEIIHKAGLDDCKPCPSPIYVKPGLSTSSDLLFSNLSLCRTLVRALQYLTITHPDLSLAVNQACQHMHAHTNGDFFAIKQLIRFVKGTLTHGLTYTLGIFDVHAFSDSNWAGDTVDRKSTFGYCIFLGSNLVSWSAKNRPLSLVPRSRLNIEL